MGGALGFRVGLWPYLLTLLALLAPPAHAGDRGRWTGSGPYIAVPTARAVPLPRRSVGSLGTFYPTSHIFVRGNGTAGGGYSPLGVYGDQTMVLYGPLSSLRSTSAPVLTYSRGYDGRTVVAQGTSFSTPNLPTLTPVVYPNQGNNYFGFRVSGDPPWWQNGINWLDQN